MAAVELSTEVVGPPPGPDVRAVEGGQIDRQVGQVAGDGVQERRSLPHLVGGHGGKDNETAQKINSGCRCVPSPIDATGPRERPRPGRDRASGDKGADAGEGAR